MAQAKGLVLVVEDEADIAEVFRLVLERAGYEVITTADGNEALALAATKNPEVVFLDIMIPGKSGMEVLSELRANYPDVAVIMETGLGDVTTAIRAMGSGAFDYLVKPFNVDAIILSVERALERRRLVLENRDYQLRLEQKVRELTGLNKMFQAYLQQRCETEDAYCRLAASIARMAEELQAVAKEAEAQKARMQFPTAESQEELPPRAV